MCICVYEIVKYKCRWLLKKNDFFRYYRDNIESGNNGKEIICVVIVKREMLRQNDVICSGSQNINDLKSCLKNKYEKLLSYFVTVKFLRETVDAVSLLTSDVSLSFVWHFQLRTMQCIVPENEQMLEFVA